MASDEVFSPEEDEILISTVAEYPILYNLNLEDYKNTRKKDKVWAVIGKKLNKRSDCCKRHWKNLKDTYNRQKRKNKSGTGSAAPKNPRSKYMYYAKLFSFLESVPHEKPTTSSVNRPNEIITQDIEDSSLSIENNSGTEDVPAPASPIVQPSPPSPPLNERVSLLRPGNRKRTKKDDVLTYLQKRDETRQNMLQLAKANEDDELVSFSGHVRAVLRKLKPRLMLQAKREIFDVLMKYELLNVDSDTESNRPSTSNSYVSDTSDHCALPNSLDNNSNDTQYALLTVSTNNTPVYSCTDVNQPGPSSSINTINCTTTQEPTDLSRHLLIHVENNNLPVYSPISQEEEPADLSRVQFHEAYY